MNHSTTVLAAAISVAVAAATTLTVLMLWGDQSSQPPRPETASTAIADLEREIESLRDELEDLRAAKRAPAPDSGPGRVTVPTITDEQIAAALDRFMTAPGSDSVVANADERVKQMVESLVQEEVSKQQSPLFETRKMAQVAATLELEPWQRETLSQELMRAAEENVESLSIPAADGTLMVDELLAVFTNADGLPPEQAQANMLALWGRLSTEVIPGTDETYAQRLTDQGQRVTAVFQQNLTASQWAEYEKLGLDDPTQIELPGSAWDKAFQDYVARRQQKK